MVVGDDMPARGTRSTETERSFTSPALPSDHLGASPATLDAPESDARLTDRQREILSIVRGQGYVTLEDLARRFDVSTQSVRRDVIRLDEIGYLQRFHGGAGAGHASVRLGYGEKQVTAAAAKERIGRAMALRVPDGASVYLDVGTTVEAVARALRGHERLHVFTNSLAAALALSGKPGIEVVVTGGLVRGADGSLVGEAATAALVPVRVDLAILACSGFEPDGSVMDFDPQKVAVKRAALRQARAAALVTDAGKFARTAVLRVAGLSDFTTLVTDAAPAGPLAERIAEAGTLIVLA